MTKELNYPIKYAVLELQEYGGWPTYEKITKGFIVSKCYVIESHIRYLKDGTTTIFHDVVFPFNNIYDFSNYLRNKSNCNEEPITPSYDIHGNLYPIDTVTYLYDYYEDALLERNKQNKKLIIELLSGISITSPNWKENYKNIEKIHTKNIDICQKYEQFITEQTKDMEATKQVEHEEKALKLLKTKE